MSLTRRPPAARARPRLTRRLGLGALMMGVQPLYLAVELLVAAAVTAPYSLANNTISDLGATTCTTVDYPFGPVAVCSPLHALMNSSFVIFSVLLAVGALLLRRWLGSGRLATTSVTLWIVSSLSSVATGLVPLDQHLELHTLVSFPVFVTQPVAMLTTALVLRQRHRRLAGSGIALAAISLVAAVVFLGTNSELGGLLERLTLWPSFLWLPFLAVAVARDPVGTRTAELER